MNDFFATKEGGERPGFHLMMGGSFIGRRKGLINHSRKKKKKKKKKKWGLLHTETPAYNQATSKGERGADLVSARNKGEER